MLATIQFLVPSTVDGLYSRPAAWDSIRSRVMDPFSKIRACHEAGRVVPGLAYRDPEVYEAEVAQIFRSCWISVACGQNVPNSGDAEPVEDFIRPLAERLAHWTESALRPLCSDEYEIQANWKFAVENFFDIYHLPVLHPQSPAGFSGALSTEDVEGSDDIIGIAMTQGYGEGSGQEEWPLPRFPDLGEDEQLRLEIFSIFSNTLLLVEPDCSQVIVWRPQSAGVTSETFANYVVSDASQAEELAGERAELRQQSLEINDQDAALFAGLQQTRMMDIGGDTQPAEAWDTAPQRFQHIWGRRLLASR